MQYIIKELRNGDSLANAKELDVLDTFEEAKEVFGDDIIVEKSPKILGTRNMGTLLVTDEERDEFIEDFIDGLDDDEIGEFSYIIEKLRNAILPVIADDELEAFAEVDLTCCEINGKRYWIEEVFMSREDLLCFAEDEDYIYYMNGRITYADDDDMRKDVVNLIRQSESIVVEDNVECPAYQALANERSKGRTILRVTNENPEYNIWIAYYE